MADATKSIQVTIDVIVNNAKAAVSDLAATTQKATDSLSKMGTGATKGAAEVTKAVTGASTVSHGFFTQTSADVLKGLASYNLLAKGVQVVTSVLTDSIRESMDAAATWALVKNNVENAGQSYDKLSGTLKAYSEAQIKMGFDDEATALSVSKLMLITKDYNEALKLNQLAMDLARSKNIDLGTASTLIAQVTQGNIRALKQYGIGLGETASIADVLNEAQDKLKGSASAYAETSAGKLATVTEQWHNIEQEVGDKLMPTIGKLFTTFEQNLPAIETGLDTIVTALDKVVDAFGIVVNGAKGFFDVLQAGISTTMGAGSHALGILGEGTAALGIGNKKAADSYMQLGDALQSGAIDKLGEAIDTGGNVTTAWNSLVDANTKVTDSSTKAGAAVAGAGAAAGDASTKFADNYKQSKDAAKAATDYAQAMQNLKDALVQVAVKQADFSFQSQADFSRFTKVISDVKMSQDEWIKESEQGFEAISSSIKGLNTDLDSLNGKVADVKKSFTDFVKSTNQSAGDSFAQIVENAKQDLKDLPQQIADASASGQDTTDLQKKMNDAQDVLAESRKDQYTSNKEFVAQLAELDKEANENSLKAAFDATQFKIAQKKAETDSAIGDLNRQIVAETEERDNFVAMQKDATIVFQQNVAARMKTGTLEISALNDLSAASDKAAASYNALAIAARNAAAAAFSSFTVTANSTVSTTGKRAAGGPVASSQTYLVGEDGPELFTPSVGGNITRNDQVADSGGVVNITINNPVVRSDSDLSAIVAQVQEVLSRRDELTRMGAYK